MVLLFLDFILSSGSPIREKIPDRYQIQIKGQIITIDAMGTQKSIAEKIRNKRADYVLALKRNHVGLYEEVELYFSERETLEGIRKKGNYVSTTEKAHGQIEKRVEGNKKPGDGRKNAPR